MLTFIVANFSTFQKLAFPVLLISSFFFYLKHAVHSIFTAIHVYRSSPFVT